MKHSGTSAILFKKAFSPIENINYHTVRSQGLSPTFIYIISQVYSVVFSCLKYEYKQNKNSAGYVSTLRTFYLTCQVTEVSRVSGRMPSKQKKKEKGKSCKKTERVTVCNVVVRLMWSWVFKAEKIEDDLQHAGWHLHTWSHFCNQSRIQTQREGGRSRSGAGRGRGLRLIVIFARLPVIFKVSGCSQHRLLDLLQCWLGLDVLDILTSQHLICLIYLKNCVHLL